MNLQKAIGRKHKTDVDDLNITPVMNIFLILIPFLLLTAVFVKISILEFSLPGTESASQGQIKTPPVLTILAIREDGFQLKTKGKTFPLISKTAATFDYQMLVEKLQAVKKQYQETKDIILAPQASIKYDTIIQVMDRCRENGFVNISISG